MHGETIKIIIQSLIFFYEYRPMDEVQIPINSLKDHTFMKCCSLNNTVDQTQAQQVHTAIITAVCHAKTSTNSTKLLWTDRICVCFPLMWHSKLQDFETNKQTGKTC
jgi:hypothetical protein